MSDSDSDAGHALIKGHSPYKYVLNILVTEQIRKDDIVNHGV